MGELILAMVGALWLGILTSISPCPLATNIAAISYIDRQIGRTRRVVLTGLLYTLGRMLTYAVLGALIVASMLSVPELSYALQKYMNKLVGPVLIIVGMVLLELISFDLPASGLLEKLRQRADMLGGASAFLLGVLFALSFCPVSAALFFGSLVPLAVKYKSGLLLPSLFGIGTGLPVLAFAVLLAAGASWVGRAYNKLTQLELWVRRITGVIITAVGIYFCLAYIFNLL